MGKSLIRVAVEKKGSQGTRGTTEERPKAISESDLYDKWSQALASAVELAEAARDYARNMPKGKALTAILPLVVVPDERLWQVVYEENGSLSGDPAPVTECVLYVGREINLGSSDAPQPFRFSHIHFFTLGGFRKFLSGMACSDAEWAKPFRGKQVRL